MPFARLTDRASVALSGPDAETFLQNLVTADITGLGSDEARPSALLTPQGKILFDFLVSRTAEGLRLDCAAAIRGDLVKRLTLYKLRAKVAVAPEEAGVFALWDEGAATGLRDGRFGDGGMRRFYGSAPEGIAEVPAARFAALRIEAGIAEAVTDFPSAEMFPHDVLLDQNGGVSFRKGCYVGQEVVSRMQHRGTARRRLMLVDGASRLTPGSTVTLAGATGGAAIGTLLGAKDNHGFAVVRIDKVAGALGRGETLAADGVPITVRVPPWAGYALPVGEEDAAPAGGAEGAA